MMWKSLGRPTLRLTITIFYTLLLPSTVLAFHRPAFHQTKTPPSSPATNSNKNANPSKSRLFSSSSSSSTITTPSTNKIGSILQKIRNTIQSRERSQDELKLGIAGFYDRSSALWEEVWGEHMHHGYYVPEDRTDHQQAQIDLIDEVLKWSGVKDDEDGPMDVVDVGCGIGGSSRHIAKKYGCRMVKGITLSPYQAKRGNELAKEQGLDDRVSFQVADALDMPFPNSTFDLVWSLESGEHMPDKSKFISELLRVARPGGRIILVTWCHRDLDKSSGESSLSKHEERLLALINRAYYLPRWCSVADYVEMLEKDHGVKDVKDEDWSYIIAPFWKAVIRSSLNWRSFWGLLRSGWKTLRGAVAMLLMLRGYNRGLIKFGLITFTKPTEEEEEEEE